jgi:hypothetical protein
VEVEGGDWGAALVGARGREKDQDEEKELKM